MIKLIRQSRKDSHCHGKPADGHAAPGLLRHFELYLPIVLLLGLVAALLLLQRVDYLWTLALNRYPIHWLSHFMGQSIFEGDWPGAGDGPVLFLSLSLILYLAAWLRPRQELLARLRPHLGFILCNGFISAVLMVHGLKFILGRARPGLVVSGELPYSDILAFGPHFISEGMFRGSFPSGHVAAFFSLMSLAYILALDPHRSKPLRLLGAAWGLLVLGGSVLMGMARSMSMSHWIGDSIVMILLCWLVLHALYFWVLRMPARSATAFGYPQVQTPPLWELRVCLWSGLGTAGLMALIFGVRSFAVQPMPWLSMLIPPGLLLLPPAAHRLYRICCYPFRLVPAAGFEEIDGPSGAEAQPGLPPQTLDASGTFSSGKLTGAASPQVQPTIPYARERQESERISPNSANL